MSKAKTATITLDYPIQLADRLLTEVTMRRPAMGDLMDHPVNANTGLKEEIALVGHLCGVMEEDLRSMDAEDYGKLQEQLLRFRGITLN